MSSVRPPPDTVKFAVCLHLNDDETRAAMDTMCELISADTGLDVQPLCAHAPSALTEALSRGEAQFAWVSPTLLLIAPQLSTVVPLLSSVRQSVSVFHSVVFSSMTSDTHSLDDMKDVRAAWVAPTSSSGYLVPRMTLARAGVDLKSAFSNEEFFDTHGEVARAVFTGKADIGATYAHFKGGDAKGELAHAGYHDAGPFVRARILARSGPIPADMIVAHRHVPIAMRIKFAGALSRLAHDPEGAHALHKTIGADDFSPVTNASLEELQALMTLAHDLEGV
jgi:ABC-type phosphate/phosphonate transport system substrate-binding protein